MSETTMDPQEELAMLQRGAKQLSKILDATLRDVVTATGSEDLIGEDGDGDWMLVNERLLALGERARTAGVVALRDAAQVAPHEVHVWLNGYIDDLEATRESS